MSTGRQALKGIAWVSLGRGVMQGFGLIVAIILARLLNAKDFGLVALATLMIGYLNVFSEQGLTIALVQKRDLENEDLDSVFWASAVAAFVVVLLVWLVAGPVGRLMHQPELTPVFRALVLIVPLNSLALVPSSLLTKNLQFKDITLRNMLGSLASGVTGVVMAVSGFGVWSIVGQYLMSSLVQLPTLWMICPWRPRWRFQWTRYGHVFRFGSTTAVAGMVDQFGRQLDRFTVGFMLGPASLGFYDMAGRIPQTVLSIGSQWIGGVFFPAFSRLHDPVALRSAFLKTTRVVLALFLPMSGLLCLCAPEIIAILFGAKWAPSAPTMFALAWTISGMMIYILNGTLSLTLGKVGKNLQLAVLDVAVGAVLYSVAARWGAPWIAWAAAIKLCLFIPLWIGSIRRSLTIGWWSYARCFLPYVTGILVMLCLARLAMLVHTPEGNWARLILKGTVGASGYLVGVLIFWHQVREMFTDVAALVRRR